MKRILRLEHELGFHETRDPDCQLCQLPDGWPTTTTVEVRG